jgi:hypothetical protein
MSNSPDLVLSVMESVRAGRSYTQTARIVGEGLTRSAVSGIVLRANGRHPNPQPRASSSRPSCTAC